MLIISYRNFLLTWGLMKWNLNQKHGFLRKFFIILKHLSKKKSLEKINTIIHKFFNEWAEDYGRWKKYLVGLLNSFEPFIMNRITFRIFIVVQSIHCKNNEFMMFTLFFTAIVLEKKIINKKVLEETMLFIQISFSGFSSRQESFELKWS